MSEASVFLPSLVFYEALRGRTQTRRVVRERATERKKRRIVVKGKEDLR